MEVSFLTSVRKGHQIRREHKRLGGVGLLLRHKELHRQYKALPSADLVLEHHLLVGEMARRRPNRGKRHVKRDALDEMKPLLPQKVINDY